MHIFFDVYIRPWSHRQKSSGSSKDPFMTYIYVSGTQRVKKQNDKLTNMIDFGDFPHSL